MRRAVVVGAGIGGVTAAGALAQAGWQVTVLERAPEMSEVGAGISIWPPALRVLDGLGIGDKLRGAASLSGSFGVRRPDGKWLVALDPSGFELPSLVHRAWLHEAILSSLPDRADVRTGVTVTGATTNGTLTTESGEPICADLVVAADGIKSVVRRELVPDGPPARYAGYTAYRGIAPAGIVDTGGETWGRSQRFGYADGRRPRLLVRDGERCRGRQCGGDRACGCTAAVR
jgi:2-polyprenyl-6-methoxyphenol hydroxylase-like FAD-dependent oxidoreductase